MFKKGRTAWNKGGKVSTATKQKISSGLKKSYANGIRKPIMLIGEENPEWKGSKVGYRALHHWVKRHKGIPDTCEYCDKSGLTGHKIHWANIDGKYRRAIEDWIRLCAKCHSDYDRGIINL